MHLYPYKRIDYYPISPIKYSVFADSPYDFHALLWASAEPP